MIDIVYWIIFIVGMLVLFTIFFIGYNFFRSFSMPSVVPPLITSRPIIRDRKLAVDGEPIRLHNLNNEQFSLELKTERGLVYHSEPYYNWQFIINARQHLSGNGRPIYEVIYPEDYQNFMGKIHTLTDILELRTKCIEVVQQNADLQRQVERLINDKNRYREQFEEEKANREYILDKTVGDVERLAKASKPQIKKTMGGIQ